MWEVHFPLRSGYNNRVVKGHTENYTISGSCSGTATFTRTAASGSAMFGTTQALIVRGTDPLILIPRAHPPLPVALTALLTTTLITYIWGQIFLTV